MATFSCLAIILYFVLLTSAMIVDKDWKLGKNYISDLGVSKNSIAKYLFNGGCVVCGLLFIISIINLILESDPTTSDYIIFILSIVMAVLLMLVGIVNEHIMPLHKHVAFSYFIVRFVLIGAFVVLDIYSAQYILAIVTVAIIVLTLISAKKLEFPVTEVIWCYSLLGIILVHFFMMG